MTQPADKDTDKDGDANMEAADKVEDAKRAMTQRNHVYQKAVAE